MGEVWREGMTVLLAAGSVTARSQAGSGTELAECQPREPGEVTIKAPEFGTVLDRNRRQMGIGGEIAAGP